MAIGFLLCTYRVADMKTYAYTKAVALYLVSATTSEKLREFLKLVCHGSGVIDHGGEDTGRDACCVRQFRAGLSPCNS
jgi:hypothetical protein